MTRYNHAYSFGFEVVSGHPRGDDLTGAQLRQAIIEGLAKRSDEEVLANCDCPFDTYEEEEDTSDPETHLCEDCKHTGKDPSEEPCKTCTTLLSKKFSCWEPQE